MPTKTKKPKKAQTLPTIQKMVALQLRKACRKLPAWELGRVKKLPPGIYWFEVLESDINEWWHTTRRQRGRVKPFTGFRPAIYPDSVQLTYFRRWKTRDQFADATFDFSDPAFEAKVAAWIGKAWGHPIRADWLTA